MGLAIQKAKILAVEMVISQDMAKKAVEVAAVEEVVNCLVAEASG